MDNLVYYPHEAERHTDTIKEVVGRACHTVYTEPGIGFRVKGGRGLLGRPAERVTVGVFQRTGCCQHKPVCTIELDRPKNETGMHKYTRGSAAFLDAAYHAGNTRLLGHLHRECPFLPKIEVTMAYQLQDPK